MWVYNPTYQIFCYIRQRLVKQGYNSNQLKLIMKIQYDHKAIHLLKTQWAKKPKNPV